jgi:metal-responsive CopG/Arc/MetJ family transcriptional regulator
MAKSIKLNSELWRRVEEYAKKAGYSSPEEFVEHAIEKELAKNEGGESAKEMERHLRGLGYLE